MTSQIIDNDFDFATYDNDIVISNRLPFIQFITPKEKDREFGFFIDVAEAAACSFSSDEWQPHTQYFDKIEAGISKEEVVDGFLTKRLQLGAREFSSEWISIVFVRRTKLLVIGPNSYGNSVPLGYYYDSEGTPTELAKKADNQDKAYYKATNYLLYFVNQDKAEFLNEIPIKYKSRGAFGGALGKEISLLQKEFNNAFVNAARMAGHTKVGNLNKEALSLVILKFKIALRDVQLPDGSKGNIACYISERCVPTSDSHQIGKVETINRQAGSAFNRVTLHYVHWKDLLINKASEMGQTILNSVEQYKDWGELHSNSPKPKPQSQISESNEYDEYFEYEYPHSTTRKLTREDLWKQTSQLLAQLGWSEEFGKKYLQENYGVTSRKFMKDEQLIDLAGKMQRELAAFGSEDDIPWDE